MAAESGKKGWMWNGEVRRTKQLGECFRPGSVRLSQSSSLLGHVLSQSEEAPSSQHLHNWLGQHRAGVQVKSSRASKGQVSRQTASKPRSPVCLINMHFDIKILATVLFLFLSKPFAFHPTLLHGKAACYSQETSLLLVALLLSAVISHLLGH